MQGDITKLLSATLRNLTIIEFKLKDLFFRDIIRDIQAQLLTSFSFFKERRDNVAQYNALKDTYRDVDMALMIIKILGHFENGLTPLLLLETNKNLLAYKQELIKTQDEPIMVPKPKTELKPADVIPKKIQSRKNIPEPASPTKQKIIALIEQKPGARGQEIINELRSITPRTIKRNLKQMVEEGLLNRRIENKGVYYSLK